MSYDSKYCAAVFWTDNNGIDGEEIEDFDTEAEARNWLTKQIMHPAQTNELWLGRKQMSLSSELMVGA